MFCKDKNHIRKPRKEIKRNGFVKNFFLSLFGNHGLQQIAFSNCFGIILHLFNYKKIVYENRY